MVCNLIKISDAHARVLKRAKNIKKHSNPCGINNCCDNNDDYLYVKPIRRPIHDRHNNSDVSVKKSNDRILKINVKSPIFNKKFDSKPISDVTISKNLDGSVDFNIYFQGNQEFDEGQISHKHGNKTYPPNPIYHNHLTDNDLNNQYYHGY